MLLLISGSLRAGSTNTAVLRTARATLPEGAHLFEEMGRLPHFDPDDDVDPLHPAVARLRAAIAEADALYFSTPEYAGALPGSFKNLLDWTVGGGEIYGKPVAWINTSGAPMGAEGAHRSLRTVLGYVGAEIVEPACVHVRVPRKAVGADGLVGDPAIRRRIAAAVAELAAGAAPEAAP